MAEIKRAVLYGKLNKVGYESLESAGAFCKSRGNPYVELVHWIHQIMQLQDSDLHHLVDYFDLNRSRLSSDITATLDDLPRGNTSVPSFSSHLDDVVERAWFYSTLLFGESSIRTGHLVIGVMKTTELRNILTSISDQFEMIKADELTDEFDRITGGSPEEELGARDGTQLGGEASEMAESSLGEPGTEETAQEALEQYAEDWTALARAGELDPVIGRQQEIRQITDVLMRRRQNNPILTGEAGVGKTAVVEGFAQRVAAGDVPPPLQNVSVRALDLGQLKAGAGVRGEYEKRIKKVIQEVESSTVPIILFIDEAHRLIGSEGGGGAEDAANLLKPALARGSLRTIAATTWSEYKKYIEKDPALTRRFQVVKVDEPDEEVATEMVRGLTDVLENHHEVQILDDGIAAAVSLSHRYIPERQLPDKAISLLDTACARVGMSQYGVPPEVENARRQIQSLKTELEIIERESAVGRKREERRQELRTRLDRERERLSELEDQWQEEKSEVERILELRNRLLERGDGENEQDDDGADGPAKKGPPEGTTGDDAEKENADDGPNDTETVTEQLKELQQDLYEKQGDSPMVMDSVGEPAVASVVAEWTGIPVGRMMASEIDSVLTLADRLEERVLGQRHALETLSRRIVTSRAGLVDPRKPQGVFMLVGPSGVGKTETALALAEALYGGEQNLITINMSEFQESHTVSTLKGAPPGYVGYGEGGVLTEAVRRRPYSVILLDEMEKAHRDVHEIFYQVFDKGVMEDGEGRMVDFKNTVILMTTNVGSELVLNMCKDPDLMPEPEGLLDSLRDTLLDTFPAALLGRLVEVPYYPISDEILHEIIELQLARIQERLERTRGATLHYDDSVVELIGDRCTNRESGARMVDSILTNTLLPSISREILEHQMEEESIDQVSVSAVDDKFEYGFE